MGTFFSSLVVGLIPSLVKPFGSSNTPQQGYTPEKDNTGIYLAIAAVIIALIVIVLIVKK